MILRNAAIFFSFFSSTLTCYIQSEQPLIIANQPFDYVTLSDQVNISEADFNKAIDIRSRILNLLAQRNNYIEKMQIDLRFAYGDSNWRNDGHHPMYPTFDILKNFDFPMLNKLLLLTTVFPGAISNLTKPGQKQKFLNNLHQAIYEGAFDHSLIQREQLADDDLTEIFETNFVNCWMQLTQQIPSSFVYKPLRKLGQIGVNCNGVIVNYDTCAYQSRINYLYELGILEHLQEVVKQRGVVRVLEIGPGYGGLAQAIQSILPQTIFILCDLPESLLFSGLYLGLTAQSTPLNFFPDQFSDEIPSFNFVPNYAFDSINCEFDLVINTYSLTEMSEFQQRYYSRKISQLIGKNGVFFEQNAGNKDHLSDYFSNRYTYPFKRTCEIELGIVDVWSNFPFTPKN